MKILVLNGPNLNMLGRREPEVYGTATLADVEKMLEQTAKESGIAMEFFQSNHEGELTDRIQLALDEKVSGILINAAAYTHTSIAIRDALAATAIPFVEVHISNVYAREDYRQHSYLSAKASGVIVGFGIEGYRLGLLGLVEILKALS